MSDNQQISGSGIGCATLLFFIFLVLKLTNVITWSWWWIFAPLWGTALLVIICLIVIYLFLKKYQ